MAPAAADGGMRGQRTQGRADIGVVSVFPKFFLAAHQRS